MALFFAISRTPQFFHDHVGPGYPRHCQTGQHRLRLSTRDSHSAPHSRLRPPAPTLRAQFMRGLLLCGIRLLKPWLSWLCRDASTRLASPATSSRPPRMARLDAGVSARERVSRSCREDACEEHRCNASTTHTVDQLGMKGTRAPADTAGGRGGRGGRRDANAAG